MLEAKHKMKLFFTYRPWEDEPDHAEWTNIDGYKCRIKRNHITGTLCGYVGVPRTHALWGVDYNNSAFNDLEVHGGLTYAEKGDDGYWYFGFDTAHADDFCPKIVEHLIEVGRKDFKFYNCMNYRTWEFVDGGVEYLASYLLSEQGRLTNVS